jgi:hypothetical protein
MCAASSRLHGWFTTGLLRRQLASTARPLSRRDGDGTHFVEFRSTCYCGSAIALTHSCRPNAHLSAEKMANLFSARGAFLGQAAAGRWPMSPYGQSRRLNPPPITSGVPRSTDVLKVSRHVSNVPAPEVTTWLDIASQNALSSRMPGVSQMNRTRGEEISPASVVAWRLAYRT